MLQPIKTIFWEKWAENFETLFTTYFETLFTTKQKSILEQAKVSKERPDFLKWSGQVKGQPVRLNSLEKW